MPAPPPASRTLGVAGAGAWGTALAQALAQSGHHILLWNRTAEVLEDIEKHHQNRKRHPGFALHENIDVTYALEDLATCDGIVVAVTAPANSEMAVNLGSRLSLKQPVVLASKGFRPSDGALMSEVWADATGRDANLVILSGPNFAREVMEEKLSAFTIAAADEDRARDVAQWFQVPYIRPYLSTDRAGVQVGGALKNILAIGGGVLDGLGLGLNARAALLPRGLTEMQRYAELRGGLRETVCGLSGTGDVMLTATSSHSRNYRLGCALGEGVPLAQAQGEIGTAEGVLAARIATATAQAQGVDLGIITAIDGIVQGDISPQKAIDYLLQRPLTREL